MSAVPKPNVPAVFDALFAVGVVVTLYLLAREVDLLSASVARLRERAWAEDFKTWKEAQPRPCPCKEKVPAQ